jgi:hypothetical protein
LGRRYGGWLTWEGLLKYRRVVLLAEASSGKSEEFRAQTEKLKKEGKAAFFFLPAPRPRRAMRRRKKL